MMMMMNKPCTNIIVEYIKNNEFRNFETGNVGKTILYHDIF